MTSIGPERTIAHAVETLAAPAIAGMNPLSNEAIWDKLYWLLAPRGQTGIALHVIAAIDVALWDIRGKALGLPVWQLLGGARSSAPVYATFGFGFYDRDELAEAAGNWAARPILGVSVWPYRRGNADAEPASRARLMNSAR